MVQQWWPTPEPWPCLFELTSETKEGGLITITANELEANREPGIIPV
jgi:hypothetical protein